MFAKYKLVRNQSSLARQWNIIWIKVRVGLNVRVSVCDSFRAHIKVRDG